MTREIEELGTICDITVCILGYHEIDSFKKKRVDTYFKIMRILAENEIMTAKRNLEIWEGVGSVFNA